MSARRTDDDAPEAERTRLLRRFEAEHRIALRDDERGDPIDFFSPFGPMIARTRVPEALVAKLNAHIDSVVRDHALSPTGREFLGTFRLTEQDTMEGGEASLGRCTADLIARYVARVDGTAVRHVSFERFWVVRQLAGMFSPVHFHSGDVSGVLYLQIPAGMGERLPSEDRTYISARRAGYLTFLSGGSQRYAKSVISFRPEVGDFYIFPGWLLHAAEPLDVEGERRSLAFNAHVT